MIECRGAREGDGDKEHDVGAERAATTAQAVRLLPRAREVRATHHGRLRAPTILLAPRPPPRPAPQRGAATPEAKGVE
jgi:hypothetical protein